ncbi:MAG: shikimate kinase [Proteobacteria bacterium]|nr:shikimate kinase [Desulfobacula sp.]MBU3953492.1 shikimate kinase [Pseudomonadota bacterium]MBU4132133.1 shikimate kinase [Pseudomonadota bacterium]
MKPIIYLIGYRCTGKSTTGKLLADLMECPFLDTDRMIEEKYMTTIEEMVKQMGWDYFRNKERKILSETGRLSNIVIATGGGIVLDPENRTFIHTHGICAWLYAETAIIVDRILADVQNLQSRPRFSNGSLFLETQKMLDLRTPLYQELGQININTGCHSPRQAASIIKRRLSHVRQ